MGKIVELKNRNETIYPITSEDSVLLTDDTNTILLSLKLANINNDILNLRASYNGETETLLLGDSKKKILPEFYEEYILNNSDDYLKLWGEYINFSNNSTEILGTILLRTKFHKFIEIQFLSYPIGAEVLIGDSKYTINNQSLLASLPELEVTLINFIQTMNVINIKIYG